MMNTTMGDEFAFVAKLLDRFRNGTITMTIDGKEVFYEDLGPRTQARFDVQHLERMARKYQGKFDRE